MGLFDKLFNRKEANSYVDNGYWEALTAYAPIFTSWDGMLYESEKVRTAIHAKAKHISKLKVELSEKALPKYGHVMKNRPNSWQTWGQFLYRLDTILEMQNTAFIVPVLDDYEELHGIYPILPSMCEIVSHQGEPWLRYTFQNGNTAAIEFNRCGILTKFQYKDDFFGAENTALEPTMELINIQNQGIAEGVKSAATYRFMARVNNFSKTNDLSKEKKRFNETNFKADGSGGVLLFPNTYDNIQQLQSKPFVIDAEQMKAINENIYDYFGVNSDILQNKAYGDSWSAFYEGEIEWFAIQFSEVLNNMLFTAAEQEKNMHVMATANRLQYMSNQDKLNVSSQMADRGIMNRDEIREMWNLPPLPNGQGKAYTIRGEYYLLNEDGSMTKKGGEEGE